MPSKEQYKILALKERIGTIVSDYEDQVANLRAELTIMNDSLQSAKNELQQVRDQFANSNAGEEVVVNGEVVDVQEEIQ